MVNFDFFLWPMVIPMVLPLVYTAFFKKKYFFEIGIITFSMIFTVIAYWPLTTGFQATANIIPKSILFVISPFILLSIYWKCKKNKEDHFSLFGLTDKNLEKSFKLGLMFIPLMLFITFLAKIIMNSPIGDPNLEVGVVSLIESFTEEFFFRGVLFLLLISRTNIKIAYITSLASFVLMHPQNFTNPFIISTII